MVNWKMTIRSSECYDSLHTTDWCLFAGLEEYQELRSDFIQEMFDEVFPDSYKIINGTVVIA